MGNSPINTTEKNRVVTLKIIQKENHLVSHVAPFSHNNINAPHPITTHMFHESTTITIFILFWYKG